VARSALCVHMTEQISTYTDKKMPFVHLNITFLTMIAALKEQLWVVCMFIHTQTIVIYMYIYKRVKSMIKQLLYLTLISRCRENACNRTEIKDQ